MMVRLLLDENVSPSLVPPLFQANVDAVALRDRGMLGASDYAVWKYAISESRALVTINGKHFLKYAYQEQLHPGLIVIPSGGDRPTQFGYVIAAIDWAQTSNAFSPNFANYFIDIGNDNSVAAQEACSQTVVVPFKAMAPTTIN